MGFGHEQLDVYRVAIEYAAWAYRLCEGLQGHRNAKEQLLRGYAVGEDSPGYRTKVIDPDPPSPDPAADPDTGRA